MTLAALIRGNSKTDLPHTANANLSKVAKVTPISTDTGLRLAGLATLALAGTGTTETVPDLWRWFALQADQIYRSSSNNATDSWDFHLVHRDAAEACCRDGDTPAARVELDKALTALQAWAITQPNLI